MEDIAADHDKKKLQLLLKDILRFGCVKVNLCLSIKFWTLFIFYLNTTVTENRAFTFSNSKKWYFQNSEY